MGWLILNVGSSTLRASLFAEAIADSSSTEPLFTATFERIDERQSHEVRWAAPSGESHRESGRWNSSVDRLEYVANRIRTHVVGTEQTITAVGHRFVHGGHQFTRPTLVNERVKRDLNALCHLAPLHQPRAIEALSAAQIVLPDARHVAVFDTTYFTTLPDDQLIYPLPYSWYEKHGVRRFGFHGISHHWCQNRAAELLRRDKSELSVVSCHLGSGCSITASRHGEAIATSMGFTPLDGVMMGTRSGSIDPGILLYMLREGGLTLDELDQALHHDSGLRGVSGISSDVRELETAASQGHARAALALTLFVDRVRSEIARMALRLGNGDVLILTGGIGEHAVGMRRRICENLEMLGWRLDPASNESVPGEGDIATPESPGRILVVQAREDLAMRDSIAELLASLSGS